MRKSRNILKALSCLTCNVTFTTYHVRKYCCSACNPHKRQPWDKSQRVCKQCSTLYTPIRKGQKYCTKACNPYRKHKDNSYYQTRHWKITRSAFIELSTNVNGILISNKFCIECYRKHNRLNDMYAVDHILSRKNGGSDSFDNLQSLCRHHHQSKSSIEGNSKRIKTLNKHAE